MKAIIALLSIGLGIATLAVRNRPNPFVGVRFAYTHLSIRAWREANTFAGIYFTLLGMIMLTLTFLPAQVFVAIYVIAIIPAIYMSYRIAKEAYEKEELSMPAQPANPIVVNVKRLLMLELIPLLAYLAVVAFFWSALPSRVAIHFSFNGISCSSEVLRISYANRYAIALYPSAVMLSVMALTALLKKDPLLVRYPRALALVQWFIFVEFLAILLYNLRLSWL